MVVAVAEAVAVGEHREQALHPAGEISESRCGEIDPRGESVPQAGKGRGGDGTVNRCVDASEHSAEREEPPRAGRQRAQHVGTLDSVQHEPAPTVDGHDLAALADRLATVCHVARSYRWDRGIARRDNGDVETARVRFYAELNDFLPADRRGHEIEVRIKEGQTVKDLVEARGVPHTEVDLIVVNGTSVGFDHRVRPGDRISVYPVFEAFDISPIVHLRPEPLRDPRFVCDVHLGALARRLRLLGFDTAWSHEVDDEWLLARALDEHRILLTRDLSLLKRRVLTHAAYVHADDPDEQVAEVVDRFHLARRARPFTRCLSCNGLLRPVAKAAVIDRLEPGTIREHDDFAQCRECGKVYWKGSHYDRLRARVEAVLETGARA